MWGLYQHKRSFGGVWLELSGAHERVLDPGRYRLGRAMTRLGRADRAAMTPPDEPATIAALLAAAEPAGRRPLGGLIERLGARGRLQGAREEGRAIGAGGAGRRRDPGRDRRLAAGRRGVACSSRCPACTSTATTFVATAAAAGAAAAIVDQPIPEVALPQLVVDRSAAALAEAAAWWYGDPSHRLGVVGITGTDGKTTTSFLVGGRARGRRRLERAHRHGRDPDRDRPRGEPRAHDDAGRPGAPAGAPGDGRRRQRRGGRRDDLARPRRGPRPRDRLRRSRS